METAGSYKSFVQAYQSTRRYNIKHSYLRSSFRSLLKRTENLAVWPKGLIRELPNFVRNHNITHLSVLERLNVY